MSDIIFIEMCKEVLKREDITPEMMASYLECFLDDPQKSEQICRWATCFLITVINKEHEYI